MVVSATRQQLSVISVWSHLKPVARVCLVVAVSSCLLVLMLLITNCCTDRLKTCETSSTDVLAAKLAQTP